MVLFLRRNLIIIYIKTHQIASIISKFSRRAFPEPPGMCATHIIISRYESNHLLFRILSEYKPKRINCSMLSKISSGAKCKYTILNV